MPMIIEPLFELPTLTILFYARTATSLWSIFHGSGRLRYGCATIGSTISQEIRSGVLAKSAGSGEPVLH
jgi:hypothetical protein